MLKITWPGSARILVLPILLSCASCVNMRKTMYFAGQKDQTLPVDAPLAKSVIEDHDLLNISVSSLSAKSSALFNMTSVSFAYSPLASNMSSMATETTGYLVSDDGKIQFPVLGEIKAAGLTNDQLGKTIAAQLEERKLLLDPVVSVRDLNFKVTVLGEVARPTVLNVPTNKITLLEALGMAGDITVYGNKANVLLIRNIGGVRTIKRLNLNSSELFDSPYYYLQANDIVYVEPNKTKVAGSGRGSQMLPTILSGLSFIAIIVSYTLK